jgi:hypothetical protein
MSRPVNDLSPKHDELAQYELSIEELDAVAAGSIFGRIYHFIKDEVNGKVDEYKMVGHSMIDAGRTLVSTIIHLF